MKNKNSWISIIFVSLISLSPRIKRALWNRWYNLLAKHDSQGLLASMNYGFIGSSRKSETGNIPPQLALYQRVLGNIDINKKRVIEVGSGRGAGAAFLTEKYAPDVYIGMDLAINASLNSTTSNNTHSLRFISGDALAIPVKPGVMDIVINIESSHCYGDLAEFISQVSSLLVKDGYFCYCDLMPVSQASRLKQLFENNAMKIVASDNITENVLASLDSTSSENSEKIRKHIPKKKRKAFADIRNTGVYNLFRSGKLVYYTFLVRKV